MITIQVAVVGAVVDMEWAPTVTDIGTLVVDMVVAGTIMVVAGMTIRHTILRIDTMTVIPTLLRMDRMVGTEGEATTMMALE
jgi:hypothetical protein